MVDQAHDPAGEPAGETPEPPHRRPFAAFLTEHRKGALHAELSEALADVVLAVVDYRKQGTLTLTIKVTPNPDGMTVTVSDDVKATPPRADRGAALWFSDERGNLTRKNPAQMEFALRDASEEE